VIVVTFHLPRGAPLGGRRPPDGFTRRVEMPQVPAVGDTVRLGEHEMPFRVKSVNWSPYDPDEPVYVVLGNRP
jgi:hypothetical protein